MTTERGRHPRTGPPAWRRLAVAGPIAALLLTAAPMAAQEGEGPTPTPITVTATSGPCAELFPAATPGVLAEPGAVAPPFDQVRLDLLATDALMTHQRALAALLAVTAASAETPDLRDWATATAAGLATDRAALGDLRAAAFPGQAPMPRAYEVALLDRALAASATPAGSGEAEIVDPLIGTAVLCDSAVSGPFDLAAIDLVSAELQRGVALGLLTGREATEPALIAIAQGQVDRETDGIGQLAAWRDAWFGPDAPIVTAPGD